VDLINVSLGVFFAVALLLEFLWLIEDSPNSFHSRFFEWLYWKF
jgi:hypothetical protein